MSDGKPTPGNGAVAETLRRLDAGQELRVDDLEGTFPAARDRFGSQLLGLRWGTFHRERVTAHLETDERHHQPFGLVHGGVWCSVIESVASVGGWLRVASAGQVVVGVNNHTDFLRSHREGRVEAVGSPLHVGRLQQLWLVELTRGSDGKAIARGQVRLQNLEPPKGPVTT